LLGRIDEAAVEYKKVLEIAPGHVDAIIHLANAYMYGGRYSEAVPLYRRALELEPHFLAAMNLGTAYYYLEQMKEAIEAYLQAEHIEPGKPIAQNNLGDAYLKIGDPASANVWYERAVQSCERYLEEGGDRRDVLERKSLLLAKLNRHEEAIRIITSLVNETAGDPETLYKAAQVFALSGDVNGLLEFTESALRAGYPREEFRHAPEFSAYQEHPKFSVLLVSDFQD